MDNFSVIATGMYVPEKIITNEEMEAWGIGVKAEWIETNTGIKARRVKSDEQNTSDLAVNACNDALRKTNLLPSDIDLIVVATISPDALMPQTSAIIRERLKAYNSACYDVQAGCAGFVFALANAYTYALANSEIKNIIVVGADSISQLVDWNNKRSCSITGDGAGAVILQRTSNEHCIKGTYLCNTVNIDVNTINAPTHYGKEIVNESCLLESNGRYINECAKVYVPDTIDKILDKVQWHITDVNFIVLSQVNINLIKEILQSYNMSLDKTHTIMHQYGYTYNSCIPIALNDAVIKGKISKGDKVILSGNGAGGYYSTVALEWAI